jgi:hypothetical protein
MFFICYADTLLLIVKAQKSDLETFSGGIWYPIDVAKPDGDPSTAEVPWIRTIDVYRLLTDEVTLLQEFPLRPLDQPPQAYLKYDSWEEHVLSIPPNEIPAKIPYSWNDDPDSEDEGRDDETSDGESEEERDKLPVSLYVAPNLFLASNLALLNFTSVETATNAENLRSKEFIMAAPNAKVRNDFLPRKVNSR